MPPRVERSELNELAREFHFSIADSELGEYEKLAEFVLGTLDSLELVQGGPHDNIDAVRQPGRRPAAGEDPYNAIVRWCHVTAGADGLLRGKRIGLKDSIAIAGIPMTCGSAVLDGFVPSQDSVITERLLRAGAMITAITNMDNFAFSGGGDTSVYGSTLCPFDLTRTAGGSSSGSAAALYYDEVDIAIGADQGGSIRIPAAWCGTIGLKPTHGLVPYVGIAGIDQTFDHCGPIALSVADAALLLQVIAGFDESDPRQRAGVTTQDYTRLVAEAGNDLTGVRFGVVEEGFSEVAGVERETAEATREAIERFRQLGAQIEVVSIPDHLSSGGISFAGFVEGMTALMSGGGNGWHWKGQYWPELASALTDGLTRSGQELPPQMKLTLICGAHLRNRYLGRYYATAQNRRPALTAAYDRVLANVDFLVMPTTPGRPHADDTTLSITERVMRGWGVLGNTAPFDMTGHPALTIPGAEAGGLPVGVMLIGRHGADGQLLAAARTYEMNFGWLPPRPPAVERIQPHCEWSFTG
jgi:amidase